MPVSVPPTFKGGYSNIGLGVAGQVLTSNGASAAPSFKTAGGGTLPAAITYGGSAAGANNDVNPGGTWPAGYGRLAVTLAAGNANWSGLVAGSDGQTVQLVNLDAANTLTLNSKNVGSLAANRFSFANDLILPPGATCWLVYWAGAIDLWVISS